MKRIIEFIKHQIYVIRNYGIRMLFVKIRRFFSLIIELFLAVLFTPAIILSRALSPFILIRFGYLQSWRIGHFAISTELYLCEKDAGLHPKKSVDFFANLKNISNKQLYKMWSRILFISPFVKPLYRANKFFPGSGKHIVLIDSNMDTRGFLTRTGAHISFTPSEERKGKKELEGLGITPDSKFVCFMVRDSAYLDKTIPAPKDYWRHHDYRDSDIKLFIPSMEELANRGYFVIRMGAIVKDALETNNPRIIDYATKFRTDFMDIYLSSKCEFFVSTGTGIDDVAKIFRRPVIYANTIPLFGDVQALTTVDLSIPKKLWWRDKQRFMTMPEILKFGVSEFWNTSDYEKAGIEIVSNTPEEINSFVVEIQERLNGSWKEGEGDEMRQNLFWSVFEKNGGLAAKYIRLRIGRDFLRDNQYLFGDNIKTGKRRSARDEQQVIGS